MTPVVPATPEAPCHHRFNTVDLQWVTADPRARDEGASWEGRPVPKRVAEGNVIVRYRCARCGLTMTRVVSFKTPPSFIQLRSDRTRVSQGEEGSRTVGTGTAAASTRPKSHD